MDQAFTHREAKKRSREEAYERQTEKELKRKATATTVAHFSSTSSSSEEEQMPTTSSTATPTTCKKTKVLSQELSMALDRTKLSDRQAVMVVGATAATLGCKIDEIVMSRSTMRRTRIAARQTIAHDIKESFECDIPLTVHWDGKLIPDLTDDAKVERLPIIVSGGGKSKLLAAPKLESGTGENIATAVVEALEDWGIKDRVQAMCFDTTASNTGKKMGACTLIEEKLEKPLLGIACRHHMLEIVIAAVFNKCHGDSSGPDILLFNRLKTKWKTFDADKLETINSNVPDKTLIIETCREHLTKVQPRADYNELLELTVIYLGETPPGGIKFHRPGALHRARWMARVIYAIKICLFHKQMQITAKEIRAMQRFALYAVQCYTCQWFVAPIAASAPSNDLSLLKKIQSYNDKEISAVATKAFNRHLWYLSEELIGLSFFDEETSLDVKREMVKALSISGSENPPKRTNLNVDGDSLQNKTLASFVTSSTLKFFTKLSFSTEFLKNDPAQWSLNNEYNAARLYIRNMNVVNDNAERGVALIQNFCGYLTKNEEQLQYLLQVVEDHRKRFPNMNKTTLKKGFHQ